MLYRTLLDSGITRSKYNDEATSSIELTNQTQDNNIIAYAQLTHLGRRNFIYRSQFRYGYYNCVSVRVVRVNLLNPL
ncbi:hypothetical protein LR48_Vigan2333s000100 [Vigna angularis]|uniref:Uncharacterized protein n=1 Tax=Vigna angularis var. angularis TaxID=157739 RepID=A0A0S3TAF7_PHAAN|nr:hypothetical protein LR48_Vigan2333s000100 [Vigna angularis]BAU01805.1 hypothetical protein VIGAN_11112200 [Vigna angularis var. angularis]